MTLQVHVAGPGVDVRRRLEAGEPALILGRDSDCAIRLPDPERNVSRRHLSVWNDGDQLHFHVLSVVNGVQTSAAGELPPGARGVLGPDEVLVLSAFHVTAAPEPAQPEFMDTWARLQDDAERLAPAEGPTAPGAAEDDPFGDWGVHSTFGAGEPGAAQAGEGPMPASDLQAFFEGLGLGATAPAGLTRGELETLGRLTRIALQALLQASELAADSRRAARAGEALAAPGGELHPLRQDAPLETKLQYLFGGATSGAGLLPPDRALAQIAAELVAHEEAMGQAVPEAIRGVLADFEPEALKKRLLGGGGRLFESVRAWDAYARDYAERSAAQPPWVQQLLDRHFARAYARALTRAKRNTGGGSAR